MRISALISKANLNFNFSQGEASIVRIGTINKQTKGNGDDVQIESFIKHEEYDRSSKQNDIALVKLKRALVLSKSKRNIRPACLWTTSVINQPKTIATGWGDTTYSGSTSDKLLKVQLDILETSKCTEYYKEESDDILISENQICAGVLSGNRDTCQGG